jgi:Ca-activated chloride channel family protein
MINYFHYDYPQPTNEDPFSINAEMAECPWNKNHRLVLIGLQGKKIPTVNLPFKFGVPD